MSKREPHVLHGSRPGEAVPEHLTAAGLAVVRHADLFAPDAPDEEWLARTGGEGWIGVTHDRRIRYKPNELAAVERHRVGLLIVVGRLPFPVLAQNFVNTRAQIEAFVEAEPRPFIARVSRPSPADLARNPAAHGGVTLGWPR